jgi:type 1 fimbria pilin
MFVLNLHNRSYHFVAYESGCCNAYVFIQKYNSDAAKTGITASATTVSTGITATSTGSPTGVGVQVKPSKTSILVDVNKNAGGEYEPLVYVLVCQQL